MIDDQYVNHEVRLQLMENAIIKLDERFTATDNRMDRGFTMFNEELKALRQELRSDFKWLMGSILGLSAIMISFLGSIALHAMKLI